jgi:hypothetical protein
MHQLRRFRAGLALRRVLRQKGYAMNWDQIETKWAAMTRRVRPDWPVTQKTGSGAALVAALGAEADVPARESGAILELTDLRSE